MLCPKCGSFSHAQTTLCGSCGHKLGGKLAGGPVARPKAVVSAGALRFLLYPSSAFLIFFLLQGLFTKYQTAEAECAEATLRYQILERKRMMLELSAQEPVQDPT